MLKLTSLASLITSKSYLSYYNKDLPADFGCTRRSIVKDQPVRTNYSINPGGTTARLDRAVAHTKSLSDTTKSLTTTASSVIEAKGSNHSALANEILTMQNLKPEDDESSYEMELLLARYAGDLKTTNSTETATAGHEVDDHVRSSQHRQ